MIHSHFQSGNTPGCLAFLALACLGASSDPLPPFGHLVLAEAVPVIVPGMWTITICWLKTLPWCKAADTWREKLNLIPTLYCRVKYTYLWPFYQLLFSLGPWIKENKSSPKTYKHLALTDCPLLKPMNWSSADRVTFLAWKMRARIEDVC